MAVDFRFYSEDVVQKISNSISLVDYFQYLQVRNVVKFDRKIGNEHYFLTDDNKFSVSANGYYDFKSDEGGQILKAVMTFEKLDWKDSLEYVKNFNQNFMQYDNDFRNNRKDLLRDESKSLEIRITKSFVPNNERLIA